MVTRPVEGSSGCLSCAVTVLVRCCRERATKNTCGRQPGLMQEVTKTKKRKLNCGQKLQSAPMDTTKTQYNYTIIINLQDLDSD